MHELKHIKIKQKGSKFKADFVCSFDNETFKGQPAIEKIMSKEYSICYIVVFQIKANVIKFYNNDKDVITMCFVISLKLSKIDQNDLQTFTIKFASNTFSLHDKVFVMDDTEWRQISVLTEHNKSYNTTQFKRTFDLTLNLDLFNNVTNIFCSMREDTEFTDFELCGEDGSVKVHKAVIAGHSPVLKTLFSGKWKETATGKVQVPNTTLETLEHLKDYVYMQKLPDNGIKELLYLASYYMMTDLQQKCSVKLLMDISAQNVTDLLDIAINHEIEYLYMAVLKTIQDNVIEIREIAKYRPFKKQNTVYPSEDVEE